MFERTQQHAPTPSCDLVHCYSHNVDEWPEFGTWPYVTCGECGHVYLKARDLRKAYRREVMNLPSGFSWWWAVWRALTIRTSKIYFCQECIHDF